MLFDKSYCIFLTLLVLMFSDSVFALSLDKDRNASEAYYNLDSLIQSAEIKLKKSGELTGLAFYPEAYDKIWEVLSLADSIQNASLKYKAYRQLSLLYSIFHSKREAIACIDSMFFYANLDGASANAIINSKLYYSAAHTFRMHQMYSQAKEYLTICEQILDSLNIPLKEKIYVLTEKAHLYTLTGKFIESEEILNQISNQISSQHSYASILYSMWGDLYSKRNKNHKALEFYNKSLVAISEQNMRIGLRSELLEKVSIINNSLGNYKLALEQLSESKLLGDSLFGSQSARNKQLFEIKDSYRKAIVENQRIQKEQELKLLKTQKEKLNQRFTFSLILILVTVVASVVVMRLLRRKHLMEKNLAEERGKAEIEIKKKELAVTALQLMEKDKLLDEIKQGLKKVKEHKDDASVERINSTIKINSTKTWNEFEARFVQVNNSFYESLGKKHPDLSRNELKLCALIKLNFSSKEMSDLLGVSADSVNKARYRLRKKLDLQRDDNLVAYINSI